VEGHDKNVFSALCAARIRQLAVGGLRLMDSLIGTLPLIKRHHLVRPRDVAPAKWDRPRMVARHRCLLAAAC